MGGAAIALLLLILLLRPTTQLLNTPEIARARRMGALRVGVLNSAPGFSYEGEGLEIQLARAMCKQIFPDADPDIMLELVPVTEYSALAKIKSGEIDFTLSMQRNKGETDDYAYSDPYYYDTVCILCRPEDMNTDLDNRSIALIDNTAARVAYDAYVERAGSNLQFVRYASYPEMVSYLEKGIVDFVAVPGAVVKAGAYLDTGAVVMHRDTLGELGYVAVSSTESPAFAMLAGVVAEQLSENGQLDAWASEYDISRFRYRK